MKSNLLQSLQFVENDGYLLAAMSSGKVCLMGRLQLITFHCNAFMFIAVSWQGFEILSVKFYLLCLYLITALAFIFLQILYIFMKCCYKNKVLALVRNVKF